MIAVPQSGPITSSPPASAASLIAISSAIGTLSEKIIRCRPASIASMASPSTAGPGSDSSTSGASGWALAAARTVRAAGLVPGPVEVGTMLADSAVSTAARAVSTALSSVPLMVINRSLGPAPAGIEKPSPAASSRLSGVAIATWAAEMPGVDAAVWESRSRVTESR